jgi:hypothetical protein
VEVVNYPGGQETVDPVSGHPGPRVIASRRQLYSESETYRMVASSVSDPGGLDDLPAGGPALIVAEGLVMYLTAADVTETTPPIGRPVRQRKAARWPAVNNGVRCCPGSFVRHHQVRHP